MLLIMSFLTISMLGLPSCVAGGSGVKVEARKHHSKTDLNIRYYSFGGADLKKLKTCHVRYDLGSLTSETEIVAVETFRKKDIVEWTASGLSLSKTGRSKVQIEIYTEVFNGRNTITSWTVNVDNLNSQYQSVNN
jgi:hypothetical protein